MFSVDGLVSGLDTSTIIESSLAPQQNRIDRLAVRKAEIAQEQTAFKSIEARLLSLQGSMSSIIRSTNNAFDKSTATSSDEEALAASASTGASAGTYRVRVTQLAQAHQIKSNGFASRSEQLEVGVLQLRVGQRAQIDINIDENNNTLQGLADTINAQSDDVIATVIDDGSDTDTRFRMLLTSKHSGAENTISMVDPAPGRRPRGGAAGGTIIAFEEPDVQEAKDAQIRIGDGPGAIVVSSDTNQFDDLIPDVTLDALSADPDKDIVINVAADTSGTVDSVQTFVDAYNDVVDFINTNSEHDAETETAGLLLGNRSAANVLSRLRNALGSVVYGANDRARTLTSVGISTNDQGKLDLNASRLTDILEGNVEGVGLEDVRRLFALDGQSTNPGVEFVLGTSKTQASPRDPNGNGLLPYEVEITRAATQAIVLGQTDVTSSVDFDNDNNQLNIELDGVELQVTIPTGTYSSEDVADQLQTLINTHTDVAGRQSIVELVEDKIQITSATYGRSSEVKILSGSANTILGLPADEASKGLDVAGVFRVELPSGEKVTEQATGNGRLLSSSLGNEYTDGLRIRSTMQESQIGGLTDAKLTVTRGIAAELDSAISELLQSNNGELSAVQDGLTRRVDTIDDDIARIQEAMERRREALVRQFSALETTIAELRSTGNSLASSLVRSI